VKYQEFKKSIDKPYFSMSDIRLRGLPVFPYQLSLWKKDSLLASFKRGLYFFPEKRESLIPEVIAYALYEPSYISLESALRAYDLIPEMIYTRTSVTPKTTRKFSNEFGNFSYRHIRPGLFFGYRMIPSGTAKYALADPEKALLDYLYLHPDIRDTEDLRGLRLNAAEIAEKVDSKKLHSYAARFGSGRLDKVVSVLVKEYLS